VLYLGTNAELLLWVYTILIWNDTVGKELNEEDQRLVLPNEVIVIIKLSEKQEKKKIKMKVE
jgi:hypothetical protein